MKIFLTGGTGFIVNNFIKIASKSNFIFAISRKKNNQKIKNVKWLNGKINSDWKKYMKKSDVLVHLASTGVLKKNVTFKECFKINVIESMMLLKNAYESGCTKWIIIGSSSEYGSTLNKSKPISKDDQLNPLDNYSVSKMILGKIALGLSKQWKTKLIYFRLFPVYGIGENKNRLVPQIKKAAKKDSNFILNNPTAKIDFNEVTNVCKTILKACDYKSSRKAYSECWHIASGKQMTIKKFALNQWKSLNSKGKIILSKKRNQHKVLHHISDKKSIWSNK